MYPLAWYLRRDIEKRGGGVRKRAKGIVIFSKGSLGMGVESKSAAGGYGGRFTVRVASGEAGDRET